MIETNSAAIGTGSFTRRRMLAGSVIGFGSLVPATARAVAQEPAAPAKTKTIVAARAIHQEEDFKCVPRRIYEALLDDKQFTAMSGGLAAEIHGEAGGVFSIFGGHIVGRNLELVPNRRIVQAWRVVPWPEGIYSIARFELLEQRGGAHVVFDHTGFPSELAETLESGWNEHYWMALRKYLA
jgi:activator of HSP90 ATPase